MDYKRDREASGDGGGGGAASVARRAAKVKWIRKVFCLTFMDVYVMLLDKRLDVRSRPEHMFDYRGTSYMD